MHFVFGLLIQQPGEGSQAREREDQSRHHSTLDVSDDEEIQCGGLKKTGDRCSRMEKASVVADGRRWYCYQHWGQR